jgi:hypothetical protein
VRIGTDTPDDIAIVRENLLEGLQSGSKKASISSEDETLAGCWLEKLSPQQHTARGNRALCYLRYRSVRMIS